MTVQRPGTTSRSTSIARFRRRPYRWLYSAFLALIACLWSGYKWWTSPEHRIQQFVGAATRGDMQRMLSLADPEEVRRLQLTPLKFQAMLRDAAGLPIRPRAGDLQWTSLGDRQTRYNRWALISLLTLDGTPLQGSQGRPMKVHVQAYNTDYGWKIGASKFIYAVLVARTGMQYRKERYMTLCWKHAIPPELYWPETGQWESVSVPQ